MISKTRIIGCLFITSISYYYAYITYQFKQLHLNRIKELEYSCLKIQKEMNINQSNEKK
jgi:hypothetical protein